MNAIERALKIVVCGPVKGGKSSIANFLAGQTEHIGNANKIYEATVGVRQGFGHGYAAAAYLEVNRGVGRPMDTSISTRCGCERLQLAGCRRSPDFRGTTGDWTLLVCWCVVRQIVAEEQLLYPLSAAVLLAHCSFARFTSHH